MRATRERTNRLAEPAYEASRCTPSGAAGRLRRFCGCGFTMVELLVVLVIIATLLVIALPRHFQAVNSARVMACQSQIRIISIAAQVFLSRNQRWPVSVAEMVQGTAPSTLSGAPLTSIPECPFGVPYILEPVLQDGSAGQPTAGNPQVGVTLNVADDFENGEWINALQHKGSGLDAF